MEEFNNIASAISMNGGTVVMAVLFIIFLYLDRKDRKDREEKQAIERKEDKEQNTKLLNELSASNRNIAESLNLLRTSIDTNTTEFRQHDERAIKGFAHIKEDLIVLKERK